MIKRLSTIPRTLLIISILALLVLSGCESGVSKSKAENNAIKFIEKNVQFYSKQDVFKGYKTEIIESYSDKGAWVIKVLVYAEVNNSIKKNNVTIKIDSKSGMVTEFNGNRILGNQN